MPLEHLTVMAIKQAIAEFDEHGREAFLEKYGYQHAREHFILWNGRHYDMRAIVGAAHAYLPGMGPIKSADMVGGRPELAELGFRTVRGVPGDVLTNDEIASRFAVGNMGGMRRSRANNHLVLISDPFKGLYQDRWEGDVLHYTGMGPRGPQSLTYSQNRTLAESTKTGVPLYLFVAQTKHRYTYVGEVVLSGQPYQETQLDDQEKARKVWMFPVRLGKGAIKPIATAEEVENLAQEQSKIAGRLSNGELARRAKLAKGKPEQRDSKSTAFARNQAVSEFAKRWAKGDCDLCGNAAPFPNRHGKPYLECHHVMWLSKGGDDTIENAVALCPNCHRKMHVLNRAGDRARLKKRALEKATNA